MPAKNLLRVSDKGTYSHIYNKGVENRLIFNDHEDYEVFLNFLKDYLTSPSDHVSNKKVFTVKGRTFQGTPHQPKNYFNKVELISYNLMPNHFHLVLHQNEQGSIESFLRSLSTRYSMYVNKKYHRQGSLFEGPYKSVQITGNDSLIAFVAYLDQKHTSNRYSSYSQYLTPQEHSFVKTELIKNLFNIAENSAFEGTKDYKSFAEKHLFTSKEKETLELLILEGKTELLERRNLTTLLPKQVETEATVKKGVPIEKKLRIPEYIGLALAFVILMGIGIRNISVSSLQAKSSVLTFSNVSEASKETHDTSFDITARFSEPETSSEVLAASDSATSSGIKATEPTDLLYDPVQVVAGVVVNIYNSPSTTSQVHRTAKGGELFEGAPTDANWYEVRLGEHTSGYIQSKYIELEQTAN